ncbi:MAG: GSCFA domain-containing protein [Cellulophaga sp.]
MKLQTQVPILKVKNQINYDSKLVLLGSCFVENIGKKLNYFKFETFQNPFGILFHPNAIETLVAYAVQNKVFTEADVFFNNERWHCFDAHSDLSDVSKEAVIEKLNNAVKNTLKQITEATHIIVTLGTAWAYRSKNNNSLVANCHKVSQKEFKKELGTVSEIQENIKNIATLIASINTKVQFVFTVSPVRHLKDGFVENQRSKAHLITAIHEMIKEQSSVYFPSYEIMMDELRDYRFYNRDMVHPNEVAIDYIWERFQRVWISEGSYETMKQVELIQKGMEHRPFNEDSGQHQKFVKSLESKMDTLQKEYPSFKF